MRPSEKSTKRGLKCARAAFFSLLAGENGSGELAST